MSVLTSKARDALPNYKFGLPKDRKYPVNNPSHARNALARVSEQLHKGNISSSDAAKVRSKAKKMLSK